MRKILLTMATICALSAPAYADHTPNAKDHDVTVHVFGLVCDFCAQAIEKVFMDRDDIVGIDVDLDNFEVIIDLTDDSNMDDETITKLITDAGYTVNDIKRPDHG